MPKEFMIPNGTEDISDGRVVDRSDIRRPLLPSVSENGVHSELRYRPSTGVVPSRLGNGEDDYEADEDDTENQDVQSHRPREFQVHHQQQRILDRNGVFRQSRGRWGIERLLASTAPMEENVHEQRRARRFFSCSYWCSWFACICCCYRKLYQEWGKDWFFWLAYKKTCVLFLLLFVSYVLIICFFGFIYLALSIFGSKAEVNPDGSTKTIAFCDMDINDHMEAMYFSLSTMTTIGYGVSDYYFGGCYTPLLLVLLQICTAIVFDAVAVGLIFHRISRGAKRSRSILFSDKAVIQNIRGIPHLMFRLGERRKYHLIEATVRCYCIKHERLPSGTERRDNDDGDQPMRIPVDTTCFVSKQMRLLQPDDQYGSHLWMGLPQVVVHRMDADSPLVPSSPIWYDVGGIGHRHSQVSPSNPASSLQGIQDFLYDREVEVVVLVEGTDEGTGAATQARHSYKLSDMAWNHKLADCVHPYNRRERNGPPSLDPVVTIDFSRFHDILPAPEDCDACPYLAK